MPVEGATMNLPGKLRAECAPARRSNAAAQIGARHGVPLREKVKLVLADVFVPDGGIFLDVMGEESDAFLGIEIDDFNARGAEPFDTALEGAAFADDDASKIKLPD